MKRKRNENATCKTCPYSQSPSQEEDIVKGNRWCFRFPPVIQDLRRPRTQESQPPIVSASWCCGEHPNFWRLE